MNKYCILFFTIIKLVKSDLFLVLLQPTLETYRDIDISIYIYIFYFDNILLLYNNK